MRLPERLGMVARLCGTCDVLADVASDIGLLATAMLTAGSARRAICCDRQLHAIRGAQDLAARLGVATRLEARVGDGLGPLAPGEADVIAVAGLGGRTIASILGAGPAVAAGARRLVLQPMRGVAELRRWLVFHGGTLLDEELVRDGSRIYAAMAASFRAAIGPAVGGRGELEEAVAREAGFPPDLPAAWVWEVGPLLWRDRHPLLPDLLETRAERDPFAELARRVRARR